MYRSSRQTAMDSAANEYSHLTYPLLVVSCSTIVMSLMILFSYGSGAWFTYQSVQIVNRTLPWNIVASGDVFTRILESGSFGLWSLCIDFSYTSHPRCDLWTERTRPHNFHRIIVLLSCALFLSNLLIFPSWVTFILLCYNRANRYLRYVVSFSWILSLLSLILLVLLISSLILVSLTQFYAPGQFHIDNQQLNFRVSAGFFYAAFATLLALVCFLSTSVTVIWRKVIEIDLVEAEKDLLRQIADETYRPARERMPRILYTATFTGDDESESPPPYNGYH